MAANILIIDDDPDALDLLRLFLDRQGYGVLTAPNGVTGTQAALDNQPDLILLDIFLPDINGYKVLEKLRNSPTTREIPVIMIGGRAHQGERLKARKAGADVYLKRPFRPQELLDKIHPLLSQT